MQGSRETAGKWISCGACVNGIVSVYSWGDFEGPGECPHCSAGRVWQYPSGALALYPGGPFCGRAALSTLEGAP